MKTTYKKNELAVEILKIVAGVGVIGAMAVAPGLTHLFRHYHAKEYRRRRQIKQSIERLRSQKYIISNNQEGNQIFKITAIGWKKVIKFDFDNMIIPKPNKWDKKWRIVIFDIPEKKKRIRNEVNFKLKDLGFMTLQKSTFIYPYDCEKEVAMIKEHFSLRKEISFIVADYIDNQQHFAREFGVFQ